MKRLFKSEKDKKLFGVCAGLGNYFEIDPTIVRIGFVVGFLVYGVGPLVYIILAIVMPKEEVQ
ncbi:MAG: PspC domain-containing protein [Chitinophagales bacterium]